MCSYGATRTLALELRMGQSGIIQQMFIWLGVIQGLHCRLHRRGPNLPPRMELGRHSSASLNVLVASVRPPAGCTFRRGYGAGRTLVYSDTGYRPAFIYVQELNRHVHSSVDVAEDDKVWHFSLS
ncbi:hypothetical protein C8J57DRAFT_1255356 [Mycena rebaudengoi]|nr:hypothetical protein C8J57DRAFT_1255356 [Mycena rebaudengoi]